jgi:hypothetical protein
MSASEFGEGPKKETVYSGPTPGTQGTVYSGPSVQTGAGTVYNGPAVGTVYNGPPSGGTVYNGAPGPVAGSALGGYRVAAVNVGAVKGARIFYVLAAFTTLRTILLFAGVQQLTLGANRIAADSMQLVLVINIVVIGILVLLGIFTQRGSKTALTIGLVLYSIDTALLLFNPAGNIVYLVVHGLFLYYLFSAYRQFAD